MAKSRRSGLIQKVRAAQHRLGIDDPDYRTILAERYDVESTKQLRIDQLADLMNHFIAVGRGEKSAAPRQSQWVEVPRDTPHAPQKRKVLALARDLGWSVKYLNDRVQQQFGVAHLLWLNSQDALQTLLKDMVNRANKRGLDPYPER